jgi:NIPSNAP
MQNLLPILLIGAAAFLPTSLRAEGRVFELRTYTAGDGKLEALSARFRDQTTRIFKKHNMEVIGYWIPQDPDKAKNTFVYMLAFPSRAAADKSWADFQADPEWKKVAAETDANGKLAIKVDRLFLDPTPYSPMK